MTVLAISLGGLLATLLQSRRVAESAISADTAAIIVQSYMEQLKSMPIALMANQNSSGVAQLSTSFSLATQSDQTTNDPLQTSTGTPPLLSSLTPGFSPSGAIDNLKDVPNQNGGLNTGSASTWNTVWPKAATYSYSAGTPYTGDFYINMWVWITDLSDSSTNATSVYGITIIYSWQYRDGNRVRYAMDEIRSIRSSVPSF